MKTHNHKRTIIAIFLIALIALPALWAAGTKEDATRKGPIEVTFWSLFTG